MIKYELVKNEFADEPVIKGTDENGQEMWIPADPANSDYQAYLRWLNGEE